MAVYDFVASNTDLDALKSSLDKEKEIMSNSFETIKNTFKSMNGSWKGESYNVFMAENVDAFSDSMQGILDTLSAYSEALANVSKSVEVLTTDIETICNGLGSGSDE
jgi:uncharacterized protein YukE